MTPRDREAMEKAEALARKMSKVFDRHLSAVAYRGLIEMIAQALEEMYENGKRDSIIEFCEGDRSMLAEYEQKAHASGYAEAKADLQLMVDAQAADEGLWFMAQYASEAYLQSELRGLHAAIEALQPKGVRG